MKKSKQKVSWPKWIFVYKKAHRGGYSRDQITQIAFCVLYLRAENHGFVLAKPLKSYFERCIIFARCNTSRNGLYLEILIIQKFSYIINHLWPLFKLFQIKPYI